jgi:hypothetical protein
LRVPPALFRKRQTKVMPSALPFDYLNAIAWSVVARLSEDAYRMFLGGEHQNPVELPSVFDGLSTPDVLVRIWSKVKLPRASVGAVPTTVPAALPVHAPFTL